MWLRTREGVRVRDWAEPSAIAYIPSSATTHLLSRAAASLLADLVDATLSRDEVIARLLPGRSPAVDAASVREDIEHFVDELIDVGLLRRLECPDESAP